MSESKTAPSLPPEPVILALDTCTEACSAALFAHGKTFSQMLDAPREHSQRLLPMVDELLAQASLTFADVDIIAYGRGPGSFTGIRICTSMTQGLALGRELPVIGISTLAAMAQEAMEQSGESRVLCAIDARMAEVYVGEYQLKDGIATLVGVEAVMAPGAVTVSDGVSLACGTGFDAYPELLALGQKEQGQKEQGQAQEHSGLRLSDKVKFPSARAMLTLARAGIAQGLHTSVDELAPVYLRDTVAWKKLPGRE
ncbi:tRNA (adenosine(37)-N6)-threonylcarbamoyltransferase complex dimerization subunit type 1 TsaB [Shewanella sp. JM162201]|uniref:tRNA threonylcarbamoyladenosine biosynthesis protein TsaB n=1 Tax=Shewanella jiangmenensis TaxID=2837387 RepID=A0ABS5V976_9GAMM|nr:tRNA (adenosine(37)-N6)-threonylcarbamoyltransferase complex dimerization subunit type 1 TsaB [Shewanella jiangmenensis]MBT1445588.1 tRNA (adenosine(37)-N6)-threonylcarbamoyltransferase complex dimerization subunit type 1 TsaB [Shewanella jiangmenensis]